MNNRLAVIHWFPLEQYPPSQNLLNYFGDRANFSVLACSTHNVACDLSEIAIDRARRYCGDAPNIEFHAEDIRSGIPAHDVQVCLVSDVLYYLSSREIASFAIELASRMSFSGQLVFANEWNKSYRDLTHPEKACQAIVKTGRWAQLSFQQRSIDEDSCLWVGVFEVTKG